MNLAPWQFLVITQLIIFLLGWPLEWTEILIIFVPIFLPLVEFFGVNPYFFAMLIALNLQTSFLTPPMAMSAYYLKGVQTKNVELLDIFRGIMPFLLIVISAMVLMYLFHWNSFMASRHIICQLRQRWITTISSLSRL